MKKLKPLYRNLTYKKFLLILVYITCLSQKKKVEKYIIKNLREKRNITLLSYGGSKEQLIKLEKQKLLEYISKGIGKNITDVRQIYLGKKINFGNQIGLLYKAIYYCYILKCKKIILDKNLYWYIKNTIKDKKYKIKIEVCRENEIKEFTTLIDKTYNFFYYSYYLRPEIRFELLRGEIFKNIPKVSTNIRDLYIYIRSDNIFSGQNPHKLYVQPPLCFYLKLINNFEFSKIYLIAQNEKNPVIIKILEYYSSIIYKKNSLKLDIALLINAYNIAGGGTSTFFQQILLLNNKKRFLFLFKIQLEPSKLFAKLNLENFYLENISNNLVMYSTREYINKMFPWRNTKEQRDFMLSYNCSNYFSYNNFIKLYI